MHRYIHLHLYVCYIVCIHYTGGGGGGDDGQTDREIQSHVLTAKGFSILSQNEIEGLERWLSGYNSLLLQKTWVLRANIT